MDIPLPKRQGKLKSQTVSIWNGTIVYVEAIGVRWEYIRNYYKWDCDFDRLNVGQWKKLVRMPTDEPILLTNG
jgi:hypothetical protein